MYQGKNPSAIRSQKWLSASLLELMNHKSYNEITIKEISEKSDLSRQTFYQVFDSKEELLEYHLDSLFDLYISEINTTTNGSIEELSRIFFVFFEENHKFIEKLIENKLIFILNNKFFSYVERIRVLVAYSSNDIADDYEIAFISSGLVGILLYWFKDKRRLNVSELALLVNNLINHHSSL